MSGEALHPRDHFPCGILRLSHLLSESGLSSSERHACIDCCHRPTTSHDVKPSRRFIGDISHSAFLRNGGMNREKRNNETKPESGWSPHAVSVSAHSSCRDPCGFSCEKGEELFRGLWPVNKGHIVVDEPAEHWGHAAKPAGGPQTACIITLVASAMNIT